MPRPQIIVNVTAALARRGAPTATGTAFMLYAGTAGPTTPVVCTSSSDATAAAVPASTAQLVGFCLAVGAPSVVVLRAAAVDPANVTQTEWTTALNLLVDDYGAGQVLIPGVTTAAAYSALLAHSATFGRCVLLDLPSTVAAATAATTAAGLAASTGSPRAGMIAAWVKMPTATGATIDTPGSVIAAGLAARGDAAAGHANNMPAGVKGRGDGQVALGTAVTVTYTKDERDALSDAGISVIRNLRGVPTLFDWRSLSTDPRFKQLNWGRMAMQLGTGLFAIAEPFLFRTIDGQGRLFAELEGAIRGYLAPLWSAGALYGTTSDDAFDVHTDSAVNTATTVQAGELHAAVEVNLSAGATKVVIDVVTSIAA